MTKHYDPSDPQNKLETEIYVDGLGRVLQTKKDAAIYQGEGKADTEMMIVSGRVTFDAFGRTVSALYPVTEVKDDTPGGFNTAKDDVKPTLGVRCAEPHDEGNTARWRYYGNALRLWQ